MQLEALSRLWLNICSHHISTKKQKIRQQETFIPWKYSSLPPRGVCSREIEIGIADDGETIESVRFHGGCSGNISGLASLCSGMKICDVIKSWTALPAVKKKDILPQRACIGAEGFSQKQNSRKRHG